MSIDSWWPWALLTALALTVPAVLLYRSVEEKPGWRVVLVGLRLGALVLLALAFAGLSCAEERGGERRELALVVDDSASMTLRGVEGLERTRLAEDLAAAFSAARPGLEFVPFTTGALASDPATALELLARRRPDLAGAVLIGDDDGAGGYAGPPGFPVNVLAVETPAAADYETLRPRAPRLIAAGRAAAVVVEVVARGGEPEPAVLTATARRLESDGEPRVLGSEGIDSTGGSREFVFTPDLPGWWLIEARLEPVSGEATERNNTRRLLVQVVDDEQTALILSAGPHPEASFLARALEELPGVEVVQLHRRPDGRFHAPDGTSVTPEVREPTAVFLVDIVPEGSLIAELSRRNDAGRGTAMIWGRPGLVVEADAAVWSLWPGLSTGTLRLVAGQARTIEAHDPLFNTAVEAGPPALLSYAEGLPVGVETILTLKNPAGRPVPGALTSSSGAPRLLLLGSGWWRWHLARRIHGDDPLYRNLTAELFSLLSTPPPGEDPRLHLERHYVEAGGELTVELDNPAGGSFSALLLDEDGASRGELTFTPDPDGVRRSRLTAPKESGLYFVRIATEKGAIVEEPFVVEPPLNELRLLNPDLAGLRRLAEEGGGNYLESPGDQPVLSPSRRTHSVVDPWRASPWFIGLVVVLLTTDWLLRRKRNLR